MRDIKTHYYYTVEIPYNAANVKAWDAYRGEHIGYDWWNHSPMLFNTEAEAIKAINESEDYKNCDWRIVRTTITSEVIQEFLNS